MPGFAGGAGEQVGGGVYGEGAGNLILGAGDGEHGGVVDGVAEDGVGSVIACCDAYAREGDDFIFVGGDVEEVVGDEAVGVDLDMGGEDAVGGDVEAANTFFDDPVVGGADGPDVAAVVLKLGDQGGEFGEDVGLDELGEEMGGGAAEGINGEAGVDGGHVAADVVLVDRLIFVAFVAGEDPVDFLGGQQFGVDGPVHEGGAGVARPECSVAVEDGDLRGEGMDASVKVRGGEAYGRSYGWGQEGLLGPPRMRCAAGSR